MILKKLRHLRILPFMEDRIRSVAEGVHDLNARCKGRVRLLFAQHEKHNGKDMLPCTPIVRCRSRILPSIAQVRLAQDIHQFTRKEIMRQSFLDGKLLLMQLLKLQPSVLPKTKFPRQIQPRIKRSILLPLSFRIITLMAKPKCLKSWHTPRK